MVKLPAMLLHERSTSWPRRLLAATLAMLILWMPMGCAGNHPQANAHGLTSSHGLSICEVRLGDAGHLTASDQPISLRAAGNEWVSFIVEIRGLPRPPAHHALSLHVDPAKATAGGGSIASDHFSAAQLISMPVNFDRAGFVRHTGLAAHQARVPRALLPLAMRGGSLDLAALRDPRRASDPSSAGEGSGQPLLLWIDLHVPSEAAAGDFATSLQILSDHAATALASVPLKLTVENFKLPKARSLIMTAPIEWADLRRLYPEVFETVTPRLLNRADPASAPAIHIIDQLITLAQANRVQVTVPQLQPTVKWPISGPPAVDWSDFDSLLAPWMSGATFADHVGLSFWPLPAIDQLDQYDQSSRLQYWKDAADHFDTHDWLTRAPVVLAAREPAQLSAEAARILAGQPHVRVMLPLRADEIRSGRKDQPPTTASSDLSSASIDRLLLAAPGLVFTPPKQPRTRNARSPGFWLDARRLRTLMPYIGPGAQEQDVCAWAWLAFLREANLIRWDDPLPSAAGPDEPADPGELVWFYPGSWFGLDHPVPTIQLKWLRRAEQDAEYLKLAKQRGDLAQATTIARLLTRPVELAADQAPDPTDTLLTGTADASAWDNARELLARCITRREPTTSSSVNPLGLDLLRWAAPQQKTMLLARSTQWTRSNGRDAMIDLTLGIDIDNVSEARPAKSQLSWTDATGQSHLPSGWVVPPRPVSIPPVTNFHVRRFDMTAQFDPAHLDGKDHRPLALTFTNGENNAASTLRFVLPVAPSDRLEPGLDISDANLKDWKPQDMIQDGPMIRLLNRPAVQQQQLQYASQPARIYTGWGDQCFYVAFRLQGIKPAGDRSRNFVQYDLGRAWGDDCCELLIQPVFADNSLGPVLHIVCKPNGIWIERKNSASAAASKWQAFQGAGIRYSGATTAAGTWTGELAIPWPAITARAHGACPLLRFNVTQHVNATGRSASWAGPIDSGRDDALMGLLYIRDNAE